MGENKIKYSHGQKFLDTSCLCDVLYCSKSQSWVSECSLKLQDVQSAWVQEVRCSVSSQTSQTVKVPSTAPGANTHACCDALSLPWRQVKIAFQISAINFLVGKWYRASRLNSGRAFPSRSVRSVSSRTQFGIGSEAWQTQQWRQCWKPLLTQTVFLQRHQLAYIRVCVCVHTQIYVYYLKKEKKDSFPPDQVKTCSTVWRDGLPWRLPISNVPFYFYLLFDKFWGTKTSHRWLLSLG